MKWSQAALLKWSELHVFELGSNWCSFSSRNALKLEGGHNAGFSDRSERFQQIQTFVPSLQGPCSSPLMLRSAIQTWQLFPDRYSSYILTRPCNCNWKRKFLPFFQKKRRATRPPALYFRRFHSSFGFAKFGANGHAWLAWAAIHHRLLFGQVGFLQLFLLEGKQGVPTRVSAGGWSPLGRNGCILDKSLDSVTAVIT